MNFKMIIFIAAFILSLMSGISQANSEGLPDILVNTGETILIQKMSDQEMSHVVGESLFVNLLGSFVKVQQLDQFLGNNDIRLDLNEYVTGGTSLNVTANLESGGGLDLTLTGLPKLTTVVAQINSLSAKLSTLRFPKFSFRR